MVRTMATEFRHAMRRLFQAPVFTIVVVATVALGVGLNAAIFSVVDAVLFQSLPYREAERLTQIVAVWENVDVANASFSGGEFSALREETRTFAAIEAVTAIRQNLTGTDLPHQVQVGWVSREFFRTLGVGATLGRTFRSDDPAGTAMLDHDLWRTAFGSDPDVIGRTIRLDGHPYTIVGVVEAGMRLHLPGLPVRFDIWKVPDALWQNGDVWSSSGTAFAAFRLIGRLADGVTLPEAGVEMARLGEELRHSVNGAADAGLRIEVEPLHERVVSEVRPTLLVLFGAVGFVLLIACANVVNLMLVRTESRQREIAVRRALGSGASGIIALLLAEALLLAGMGGFAGIGFAQLGIGAVRAFAPAELPLVETVALDLRVAGFALALTVVCALVFGLLPAFRSRRDASLAVLGNPRNAGGIGGQGLTRLLVITQLSLSLVLLIGATLLASSLERLRDVHPGFEPDGVLTFAVSLPGTSYQRPTGTHAFLEELESRLQDMPGVESAGVVWPLPLSGRRWADDYRTDRSVGDDRVLAEYRLATSDYFETMRIPLVEGRTFGPADARNVVLISRAVAERNWPGESAVGRRVRATPWGGPLAEFEVIGVVGDVHQLDLREPAPATLYFDSRGWSWTDWEVNFVVRSSVELASLVAPIRELLAGMDAQIPLAAAQPMPDFIDRELAPTRFALRLIGLFAGLAGMLALIGLYGVVTFWVTRRTRELGIRLALGSERTGILSLVLGQGARLSLIGIVLGTAGAYALTRLLQRFLFGVSPTDPIAFAGVAVALCTCALLACAVPALRATRVDPVRVLRSD